ncbi:MAG: hypothetical protein A2284_03095 [Deltaproteobacteria bacterium RIFOXYA12_FULL_61_11]|nr:MAG: hypothetical protein A2284_03095 [Deltaproteobacteria bacterium RIFOXYA12_FULL_61_11]
MTETKKAPAPGQEIQAIEAVLERTIRPHMRNDGGDLRLVSYQDKVLTIHYQGACGSCPSAMFGTLQAIQDILRREYDPAIRVVPEGMGASHSHHCC